MSKPVKTIRVLRAARKLVADERTWTEKCAAKDDRGMIVAPHDETAVAWCASGAVVRACYQLCVSENDAMPLHESLDRIAFRDYRLYYLFNLNDVRGRLAALSVIDAAIAELAAK